jgi:hypothetical protein
MYANEHIKKKIPKLLAIAEFIFQIDLLTKKC